jgi:hypothetical protein
MQQPNYKNLMKKIRTKIVRAAILAAFILYGGGAAIADTTTLIVAFGGGLQRSQSLQIPTNVVAEIVSVSVNNAMVLVSFPQTPLTLFSGQGQILVGPATITLTNTANAGISICTIQTSPAISTLSFSPSTAVVIPNDNGGPVTIILESSTDLVTWTAALPGTYGTTTSNRFFRVRAQR